MLPCVCSVTDHRWRQNVVRTKKWHTRRRRVCHWCSYHILTSSVIYYWIRHTATWNLFVLYNNEIYKSWRKWWKIKSVFVIGAALWAEKLGRCLENYRRSWKNTLGKLVVTVNLEAMWFEFWRKERKWRWRFLSSVVGDSQISLI